MSVRRNRSKRVEVMTRSHFLTLSRRAKERWTERLRHEGFPLDRVVAFEFYDSVILNVTQYERDTDGQLVTHQCGTAGCDLGGHFVPQHIDLFDRKAAI